MALLDIPCLSLAIGRLRATQAPHFAIHVIQAPYRAGYVLHDSIWSDDLAQLWWSWQELFSARGLPDVPHVSQARPPVLIEPPLGQPVSRGARLMQTLGVALWQWLFEGAIQSSLDQSQGIAIGQGKPLRIRLDVRDPGLIEIPWEIMQSDAGKQAVSLSQQLLFSRTTSDVDALPLLRSEQSLTILLVLGQDAAPGTGSNVAPSDGTQNAALNRLRLEQEAIALTRILKSPEPRGETGRRSAPCRVDTLLQPTPAELTEAIETKRYNVLFYAGHGVPAPDGGMLFLRPDLPMNGTELAQVLTRCQVKLAVFNACWGAQSDRQGYQAIPRSSLAEVLLHHGVPAVLAMRDSITDEEALSFIEVFAQALAQRMPIDQAVAVARQHLLTLFRFNHQAWTLPVLYMHPEFDGELLKPLDESLTQIPRTPSQLGQPTPIAALRSLDTSRVWQIRGGLMRVGMSTENDVVLTSEPGVSRKHAEIFYRSVVEGANQPTYFLRDFSRYGTWVTVAGDWQKVHHQEVCLQPGAQLKFGGSQNSVLEFSVMLSDAP
ncbi:CHAT domain-containing protein [Myxacorys almedinensis]|uniref:CHAT domain-containing protein n=1 Tax=Myxacorys almedinensis A TaxID=2690445 RepID=A0A8J8CIE9_9CYAN|nr:CHAT domain-containing protein [Myxacorys almedinensis]NDJ17688.1 CHAT domain-containing protein [Myxacorys almedinensis A]